ncbi:aldo/keto reductase [Methylobacterium sp. R2-1]|uniref:aldo/keto reductase n=1 Tax=Methylobacterium sp. R2-1 TaxID=2587064 RepID=UPI001618AFBE|nr:aldo/keto reductase [Methylobacterium sp. R2-1]MBB2962916.1 aryl-alcohol dehydrogenase-like predicted oxidoreductase [Methylobacterium sp. R2-1]
MASVEASGTFAIGGDLTVHRLGFGAMRVTGAGIWGDPPDREKAKVTLRAVPGLGIDLIDTADSYGPFVSEDLIRETLHPYKGLVIATKGGLTRHGPDIWRPVGNPDYLRQCVLMSLRRLGLERIDLWQLHRIGPDCPREVQFEAIARMREEGLIRHVGLSEVSVEDIEAAQNYFSVASVQNRYNLVDRTSEAVLAYCEQHGIGFIPWAPLDKGSLTGPGSALESIAARVGASGGAVALAWLLKRSPVILPIPGTGDPGHLEENVAGADLHLSDEDFAVLDRAGREAWRSTSAG